MEQNEESLIESLPADIYAQIVTLARVYDIQLIIAALDALYFLSELGESMCEAISLVRHCIGMLSDTGSASQYSWLVMGLEFVKLEMNTV